MNLFKKQPSKSMPDHTADIISLKAEIAALKTKVETLEKFKGELSYFPYSFLSETRTLTAADIFARFDELYRFLGVNREENEMPPKHDLKKKPTVNEVLLSATTGITKRKP